MTRACLAATVLFIVSLGLPADLFAQSAGGALAGLVVDEQGATVRGVAITVRNPDTGFTRTTTTDESGVYHLAALPVGNYDIAAVHDGFKRVDHRDIDIEVTRVLSLDFRLEVAPVAVTVTVAGRAPLVSTYSAVVGDHVDLARIQGLPLNGRQFANLVSTLPGISVGFHLDATKADQYTPVVAGGSGRNLNFIVDGGDDNDDTVGGLLQPFPLEAIQEFNVLTNGAGAEYSRNAGAVMNIVTKSGTNTRDGSWFTFGRDGALNARTTTEQLADVEKQAYRRWQYGGSTGGPIVRDRLHYFSAFERTAQDTFQPVTSGGLYPELDGTYAVARRENLFHLKLTWNTGQGGYFAARVGRSTSTIPSGVTPRIAPPSWGSGENSFNSTNLAYTRAIGRSAVNELVVQYADFANQITANSTATRESFPNGVLVGVAGGVPQATTQTKWFLRDDISWRVAGHGGLGHDIKAGVTVATPTIGFPNLTIPAFLSVHHVTNDRNGPLDTLSVVGPFTESDATVNVPLRQYGVYVQDVWRPRPRLTVNAGVRYDLTTGFAIDQSSNGNFVTLQAAGRAGRFQGVQGFEDFGKDPRNDVDNVQPRIGVVFDVDGAGRRVIRASWGIYSDTGYINANILFPAADAATGEQGGVASFSVSDTSGIRNPDGSFFRLTDPLSNIASQNQSAGPLAFGHTASPRLEQPYARRASAGMSSQVGLTVLSVDYVHDAGRDLSMRPQLNTRVNGGARRFADLTFSPANFRIVISKGRSQYDAMIASVSRRGRALDLSASYTLSRSLSSGGRPLDDLGLGAFIQDATQPFAPVQFGPSAGDARHMANASAILSLGHGLQIAPIFLVRSAFPVHITEGVDLNNDGQNTEIGALAFRFDGHDQPPKSIGTCSTVDCGRGAAFSQMNLRVSKRFVLSRTIRVEAIAEVFNLLNASNPAGFNPPSGRRFLGTVAAPVPNPDFMAPTAYAGDFQQPEQRVGQLGFRVTF